MKAAFGARFFRGAALRADFRLVFAAAFRAPFFAVDFRAEPFFAVLFLPPFFLVAIDDLSD
jgi:hypothetical protein